MTQFLDGLSVSAIGMLVVFAGLIILIGCVCLLTAVMRGGHERHQEAPASDRSPAPVVYEAAPAQDDSLIAVITAAVACALAQEHGTQPDTSGFVVRRIRRVPPLEPRAQAARQEQMYSRR